MNFPVGKDYDFYHTQANYHKETYLLLKNAITNQIISYLSLLM